MSVYVKNFGLRILAGICLFFGVVTLLTPIPFGIFLLAIGTALMMMTSKTAIRLVRGLGGDFHSLINSCMPRNISFPQSWLKRLIEPISELRRRLRMCKMAYDQSARRILPVVDFNQ